jgi:MFS family permease
MRRDVYLLALVQIFVALSMGIVGPIYSIYFERISGNIKDVGVLIGIYWIMIGIMEIPFGILCDKIGKGKVFTIGGILTSISIFLYPFASKLYQLVITQLIGAIGYAMQLPSFYALLAEITRKERRGLEIGVVDSSWNIFYGLASIFSTILVATFGFSLVFSLASFLHLSSSIIVGRRMKEV